MNNFFLLILNEFYLFIAFNFCKKKENVIGKKKIMRQKNKIFTVLSNEFQFNFIYENVRCEREEKKKEL